MKAGKELLKKLDASFAELVKAGDLAKRIVDGDLDERVEADCRIVQVGELSEVHRPNDTYNVYYVKS